ncbi:MAG: hypothetical protein NZM37_03405 [Sandaracinaceae bacterium]|nr:hypothetical protein [Sandaracinaceae bacterium]MDW8246863.1 hypothetical protein [Sandaracinaceae bacterium]
MDLMRDEASAQPVAFFPNLDAEHELEMGAAWMPPRALRDRLEAIARAMPLPRGMIRLGFGGEAPPLPPLTRVRFWCPTPRAIAKAKQLGLLIEPTPPIDVIRRVNERGFAHAIAGHELEPSFVVEHLEALEEIVGQPSPTGFWRLKKGLGAAGRGQEIVPSGKALSPPMRSWASRALRFGRIYVEPNLEVEREFCVYGWVSRGGGVRLTGHRGQKADPRGRFLKAGRIEKEECLGFGRQMEEAAERVGVALLEAGYEGPFGIDGYAYRKPNGILCLRSVSEINARYCMGWDEGDGFEPHAF